jgi:hypothetical protein
MLVDTSRTLELPRGQLQRTTRRNLGHTLTAVRAARGGGTPVLLDQLPDLCALGRSAQVLIPGLHLSPRRRVVPGESQYDMLKRNLYNLYARVVQADVVYMVTSGELEEHAPSNLAARKQREQLLRHNVLAAMGDVPLHIVTVVRPRPGRNSHSGSPAEDGHVRTELVDRRQ